MFGISLENKKELSDISFVLSVNSKGTSKDLVSFSGFMCCNICVRDWKIINNIVLHLLKMVLFFFINIYISNTRNLYISLEVAKTFTDFFFFLLKTFYSAIEQLLLSMCRLM